jgi:hypothetical protein
MGLLTEACRIAEMTLVKTLGPLADGIWWKWEASDAEDGRAVFGYRTARPPSLVHRGSSRHPASLERCVEARAANVIDWLRARRREEGTWVCPDMARPASARGLLRLRVSAGLLVRLAPHGRTK